MFSYYACGLAIHSALALPELQESDARAADVIIRRGRVSQEFVRPLDPGQQLAADRDEVRLFWKDVGAFRVVGGREIIVDAAEGAEDQVLRLFILGRVIASLLHQRGMLVLHASAVAVNGESIAFLGGKGWGKSTMALAMYKSGYSIVADDVLAVDVNGPAGPTVYPGFPQLKLWPEAASSLGDSVDALPRLHPAFDKRARTVAEGFSPEAVPLKHVYVLNEGDEQGVATMQPAKGFLELLRHSYAAQLLKPTGSSSLHFRQCVKLANSVSIHLLTKTPSLFALPELARFVSEGNQRGFLQTKVQEDLSAASVGR